MKAEGREGSSNGARRGRGRQKRISSKRRQGERGRRGASSEGGEEAREGCKGGHPLL